MKIKMLQRKSLIFSQNKLEKIFVEIGLRQVSISDDFRLCVFCNFIKININESICLFPEDSQSDLSIHREENQKE